MRAEDVIGVSFFALLLPALVVAISGAAKTLPDRQQAQRRGWGLAAISFAFTAFGLLNVLFIHNSPRPVVEGNLWDVREQFDTRHRSSVFRITDDSGHAVQIRCKYSGPGLREGDRARVRYSAYDRKLLELEMLSGSFTGWHFEEPSGERGSWGWVAIGAVCGWFAYRQLAKARQETSTAA